MNAIETPLINCFIALMLFILWAWDLPERSLLNRLVTRLRWPIQRLGLWHSWQMFCPDPLVDNCRLQFKLRLADGSVVIIEPEYFLYPDVQRRPVHYRWAKIKIALLRANSAPLRRSICKFIAAEYLTRSEARGSDKRPVEVQIIRWRQRVVPLEDSRVARGEPYQGRIIHTQSIAPAPPTSMAADDGGRASTGPFLETPC